MSWPPFDRTLVEVNVMVGYFSTSKKSGLFKCLSRLAFCVLIEATPMLAFTLTVSGFAGSPSISTLYSPKLPSTSNISVSAVKLTSLWVRSNLRAEKLANAVELTSRTPSAAPSVLRTTFFMDCFLWYMAFGTGHARKCFGEAPAS